MSFLNTAVSRLGTLAVGVVLARVLGPEQFGTFAVATVALLAMLSFNELGVSLAVVRWKEDPATIAPTVATLSVITSTVLTALVMVTAPAFAQAMGSPESTDAVRLMSLSILLSGLVATPAALMQREFKQGRRMVIDQVNTWVGAALSLVLALNGLGALSLAIGRVTGSAVAAVMFIRWSPLPFRLGFSPHVARKLLGFGLPLAGASIVVFAVGYVDQLTIGALLGPTALGFYVLAFNLSSWPVSIFSQPLRSVAPAAFSRLQHDPDAMSEAFLKILGVLAAVTIPACLVLSGAAHQIISFVYGSAWASAAPVLVFLGCVAAARILFELAYDYLVVRGQSRAIFAVQVVWLVLLVPLLVMGTSTWGLRGAAAAQVVVSVLVILPLYALLLRRVGINVAKTLSRLWLPVLTALTVGVLTMLIGREVESSLKACLASAAVALTAIALLLVQQRSSIPVLRRVRGTSPQLQASELHP